MGTKDNLHARNCPCQTPTLISSPTISIWLNVLRLQWLKLIRNVPLNCKHQNGAKNPQQCTRTHTHTVWELCVYSTTGSFLSWWLQFSMKFPCDWARDGRENWSIKCRKCRFLACLSTKEFDLWLLFIFSPPPSYAFWEKDREKEKREGGRAIQSKHVSCLSHSQRNVGKSSQCCQTVHEIRALSS